MDDETTPLRAHGRSASAPRDTRGRYLSQPKSDRVTSRGNSKTYIIKRLPRGGHHVLNRMIRNREIFAGEGARRAGFGGPPRTHRPPKPSEPVVDPKTFAKILVG